MIADKCGISRKHSKKHKQIGNEKHTKKVHRIKWEIKKILLLAVTLFSLLCAFIYWSVQRILTANANEYMVVSEQKLLNELYYRNDKIENYVRTMSGDQRVQKLLTDPVSNQIQYINDVEGLITRYRILKPGIADTALVSADMCYSSVFHDEELEEICAQITELEYLRRLWQKYAQT